VDKRRDIERKKMTSIVSNVPMGGRVLNWHYNIPGHSMSPAEAFEMAQNIRSHFLYLLNEQNFSVEKARKELLKNNEVMLFSSENCFPSLYKMATSKETTDDDFQAVFNLVLLRNQVNEGKKTEKEAENEAVNIAAAVKQNKESNANPI
jgi:hypothetical protein